jgi:hypothetical protein
VETRRRTNNKEEQAALTHAMIAITIWVGRTRETAQLTISKYFQINLYNIQYHKTTRERERTCQTLSHLTLTCCVCCFILPNNRVAGSVRFWFTDVPAFDAREDFLSHSQSSVEEEAAAAQLFRFKK